MLAATGVQADPTARAAAVGAAATVTINFHPDRLLADGRPVAQGLYEDGRYRSQFETSISSGGLTAYPGGRRAARRGRGVAPRLRPAPRPHPG